MEAVSFIRSGMDTERLGTEEFCYSPKTINVIRVFRRGIIQSG
jgi:hypothetical protein